MFRIKFEQPCRVLGPGWIMSPGLLRSDSRGEFKAGDIGLIDIDAQVSHGDRALVTNGASWAIMRIQKTEDGYTFAPLGRSPLQPWFVDKLDGYVVGKLVKVFSRGDAKVFKPESD